MTISHGTKIKELRKLVGLSQEELGRRVGVQRAAINKYEKGTVTNIPIQTIEKMAQALDVSPQYLVGWTDDNYSGLSMEVKVIGGVNQFYGKKAVKLLEQFSHLTPQGKTRLLQYMDDIYAAHKDPNIK